MSLTAENKTQLIIDYATHEGDTGSPQVQISVLTGRINGLTDHMRTHKHDFASRRGLLMMVSKRNKLLKYLSRVNRDGYLGLIKKLGLRK